MSPAIIVLIAKQSITDKNIGFLAQLVERHAYTVNVVRSNLAEPTKHVAVAERPIASDCKSEKP